MDPETKARRVFIIPREVAASRMGVYINKKKVGKDTHESRAKNVPKLFKEFENNFTLEMADGPTKSA